MVMTCTRRIISNFTQSILLALFLEFPVINEQCFTDQKNVFPLFLSMPNMQVNAGNARKQALTLKFILKAKCFPPQTSETEDLNHSCGLPDYPLSKGCQSFCYLTYLVLQICGLCF